MFARKARKVGESWQFSKKIHFDIIIIIILVY